MNLCLYHHFRYFLQLIDMKVIFARLYGFSKFSPGLCEILFNSQFWQSRMVFMEEKSFQAIFAPLELLRTAKSAASLACLGLRVWLVMRGYGDPFPFVFNDEFGALSGTLPWAAFFLLLQCSINKRYSPILWNLGCVALCSPIFLDIFAQLRSYALADALLSLVAGFGFAAAFHAITAQMSMLAINGLIAAACSGLICGCLLIQGVFWLPANSLALLPAVIALLLKLILGNPDCQTGKPEGSQAKIRAICGMAATFMLAGFSFGLYGSLLAVLVPLPPQPYLPVAFIFAAASCASGLSIYMARKNFVWKVALLVCPFILIGYTAWPILHRESPAISLISLHLANVFLATLTTTALFRSGGKGPGLSPANSPGSLNAACLLAGIIAGLELMPLMRQAFSSGTAINYLFALLSLTILISCWAMIFFLGKMRFWKMDMLRESAEGDEALPGENPEEDENAVRENYEKAFSELGLTRQQSVIAACLSLKKDDAFICASLNISPNTLKTHVRNILQKLELNSRYELPWLIARACQDHIRPRAKAR